MTITVEEWRRRVHLNIEDHQDKLDKLSNRLSLLEKKLDPVFAEHMETRILETLRSENKPRSWRWVTHRFGYDAWEALRNLKKKGQVIESRSGYHTMYVAKES